LTAFTYVLTLNIYSIIRDMQLQNKHIILGITGGIAAYKAAELTRLLVKAGAQVRVVMTQSATEFITPLTLQALSGHEVRTEMMDKAAEAAMSHIELARWADLIVVAPATANFMAKLTYGMADDLLSTICLATTETINIAPAMNHIMWQNAATQENIKILQQRGVTLLGPSSGEQACGEIGPGRMLEPQDIVDELQKQQAEQLLAGLTVMVTTGPTQEAIDPVRYLSNRSSGKMGYAIANAIIEAGAKCILISGPVNLTPPSEANTTQVTTAQQMHDAVMSQISGCDIFISTAAVADYRITTPATQKIKKSDDSLNLQLTPNPDILADVAKIHPKVFTVGFAAETQNLETNAQAKLKNKGIDMIAANDVSQEGIGFDEDDNALRVFWSNGEQQLPKTSKAKLAKDLTELIGQIYKAKSID